MSEDLALVFTQYPVLAALGIDDRKVKDNFDGTGSQWSWLGFHGGVDIRPSRAGLAGELVFPARAGTVDGIGNLYGEAFGKQVRLRHRFSYGGVEYVRFTTYCHLDAYRSGLDRGDVLPDYRHLGRVGESGSGADNPHVHFIYAKDRIITKSNARDVLIDPYGHLDKIWRALS